MDTTGFLLGNLLVLVLFVTIFLAFILFLIYLRCIIKKYILSLNRNLSSSSPSSSAPELQERPRPHNSIKKYSVDTECETETTVLMIPQHALRMSQFHYENEGEDEILRQLHEKHGGGNRKSNFFRLPKDRKESYLKFNSVDDDLDELSDYLQMPTRHTLPFANLRRNGQGLYRKCTWDKKSLVQNMTRNKNGDRKFKDENPKEPLIQTNNNRFCMLLNRTGSINKEILI